MPKSPPPRARARARVLAILSLAGLVWLTFTASGCAHRRPPILPWQREHLAKRGMRLDMPDELTEARFGQHWLGSREGSDLGFGEPGGGCGCN